MKTLLYAFSAIIFLSLSACEQSRISIPKDKVKIEVNKIYDGDNLIIYLLDIKFHGERIVRLSEEGGLSQAKIEPDRESGISTCEVLILADRMTINDKCRIKRLNQIRGSGGTVGGPDEYTLKASDKLEDLLKMEIESGEYNIDSVIKLASFQNRPLNLVFARQFADN
jgi:hypothetical protein